MKNDIEILKKPNQTIMITNNKITVLQRKAYNIILNQAQQELRKDNTKTSFLFQISDLKKRAGINANNNKELKDGLIALKRIEIQTIKDNSNWGIFNLISYINRVENLIKIELPEPIRIALINNDFYTTLDLLIIKSLTGKYSVILYEMAIRYLKVEIPILSIEDFKKFLGIDNIETYNNFAAIKRTIIVPAIKEINEKTDISLDYELKFTGRKTTHIKFKITKKESNKQIELKNLENENIILENNDLEKLLNLLPNTEPLDIWTQKLSEALKNHSFEMIQADLIYTVKHKPVNLLSYFEKSIKNGHYSAYEEAKKKSKELTKKNKLEKLEKEKFEKQRLEKEQNDKINEKYNNLSLIELEYFENKYNSLPENIKKSIAKENLIKAMIKEFFEKK